MEIKKVLAAYDGSGGSREALDYAIDLARKEDAGLTVVHVVKEKAVASTNPAPRIPYGTGTGIGSDGYARGEYHEESKKEGVILDYKSTEQITKEIEEKFSFGTRTADIEILQGNPAEEIPRYAQENEVDLIVVGNRGLSGIKKLMMGSVSQKIVDHAHCPVLVVK
ncbi:universal stress protein [Pseudalkalibacillus caeni]|uniref:Universal stress protein n=1 Tax=Exobacillus caeni TaxID=2574798 RepID=A0A5R9F9B4_9BACL|nr:universal stress protein [Pseudalkalibacillus caeni]TLS38228.1 universal stress protein [Pseudalkalibacillus caeni]